MILSGQDSVFRPSFGPADFLAACERFFNRRRRSRFHPLFSILHLRLRLRRAAFFAVSALVLQAALTDARQWDRLS
jgi:hypothetical protein